MPPEKHALLSASSASRWLKCTAAPRFEEHLPERTSEYAEEGRLAHAICELKTLKKFTVMTSRTYTTRLNKLKKNPLYSEEMDKTSDLYIEHLIEQAMLYDSTPTVVAEVQVDFGEYVPEGFGTCDNVMIGGDTLSITDYKHGKGVPVSAVGNPQMRLYALGALKRYAPVFGDAIKKVRMSIDQPRLDSYTTDTKVIEGNMSDAVGYRKLAVNGRYIRGFGVPKYASKATSAPSGGGEASTPGKDEKPTPGLAVGSVVTFTGTKHYISSMAVNGKSCKPGEAKVTAVAKSGKHPYHLIKTTGSSSTVYGWVDAADVKEVVPAIVKGSRVKVAKGAKTYNGGSLASYVYTTTYTVIQIDGSRVVIGINGVVTAAVNIKDLTLVG